MSYFTSAEAAGYLRMKDRKLYELVAEGAIPCSKVTGRWLFPKAELDRWVLAGLASAKVAAHPPPIVGGSHDPLLEWALQESESGLATLAVGSEAGLAHFVNGEVVAAAIHLHALNGADTDANVAAMAARPAFADAVLIGFVRREQGLLVPPGNPKKIKGVADLAKGKLRIAQRQPGAGAQQLLIALLARAGYGLDAVRRADPLCATGSELANAVRSGRADCGVATRAVAAAAGLDFAPLIWEDFDLALRQRDYFRSPLQQLTAFIRGKRFLSRAKDMGGYDTASAGVVRYVG